MQNLNQNHSISLDRSIMNWLTEHSATILIIATLATFLVLGILEFFYYSENFEGAVNGKIAIAIAIFLALIIQGIRCATVANSAKLFRVNKRGRGIIVLLISLGVTIFCSFNMSNLAEAWGTGNVVKTNTILAAVQLIVWAGFVLEIMLAISVSGENPQSPKSKNHQHNGHHVPFHHNGATH